jgi:hypothetical protein
MRTEHKEGEIVLTRTYAGPVVHAQLEKRHLSRPGKWGATGWSAILIYEEDVKALIKAGVPYDPAEKPEVWVYDYEILEKDES